MEDVSGFYSNHVYIGLNYCNVFQMFPLQPTSSRPHLEAGWLGGSVASPPRVGLCLVGLGFVWSREPAGVPEPLRLLHRQVADTEALGLPCCRLKAPVTGN